MRSAVFDLIVGCAVAFATTAVFAQQYPAKPVRVIVPFPPGNTADILARLIGEKFTQRYAQQMIVENRPGASGQLGLELAQMGATAERRRAHPAQKAVQPGHVAAA